jgi:hypothetical protein
VPAPRGTFGPRRWGMSALVIGGVQVLAADALHYLAEEVPIVEHGSSAFVVGEATQALEQLYYDFRTARPALRRVYSARGLSGTDRAARSLLRRRLAGAKDIEAVLGPGGARALIDLRECTGRTYSAIMEGLVPAEHKVKTCANTPTAQNAGIPWRGRSPSARRNKTATRAISCSRPSSTAAGASARSRG